MDGSYGERVALVSVFPEAPKIFDDGEDNPKVLLLTKEFSPITKGVGGDEFVDDDGDLLLLDLFRLFDDVVVVGIINEEDEDELGGEDGSTNRC
ncbi:hypothetical protein QR98_0065880 [Sarcoptes scabiei]|uniref:Uncharacterized protein n=1 Tax=Sarcoptes scabiei TaxID=52283 RepID=A0A132AAS6_SARSC|nr:hypothetical protein QR98_0065880 [Sarcoptes scabiei]